MRRAVTAAVVVLAALPCRAQVSEQVIKAFARASMNYAPGTTVSVTEITPGITPGGPYQAVRVERTSIMPDAKDNLAMLVDSQAGMIAAGLLFPLPATEPPVTPETLPLFVQQVLPQALGNWLGNKVKVPWPMSPTKPGAVIPLVAQVETGYGAMKMPLAVSGDGKYLVIGGMWPLARDPREVRREILDHAEVQWDPGHENAPVKLVEFSDFQCPGCKMGWGNVKPILARFGDKVRHGIVTFPLVNIHPWAFRAAVAGYCIGQFWPERVVDLKEECYRLQGTLTVESLDDVVYSFLASNGLSKERFLGCYLKDPSVDAVLRHLDLGYRVGVFGTPTFFAGGESLPWAETEWFEKRLEAIVAAGGRPEAAAEIVAKPPTPTPTPTKAPAEAQPKK
ncbi:MAG TPA: thioredoxin domain-containing protein [Thermoanaerobaculaceae bacterium]|nr:thioredoxin domain-containing protein [Thermoanaerobaculaceae bacterium]